MFVSCFLLTHCDGWLTGSIVDWLVGLLFIVGLFVYLPDGQFVFLLFESLFDVFTSWLYIYFVAWMVRMVCAFSD